MIRAILVDDEESARNVLENLVKRFCPEIELVDKCTDVTTAVASIKKHTPELVFMDIEMPDHSGFEIVDFFKEVEFDIIFVTAYDQYAIRAFEVSAIDYLLKPIDIDRLKLAVQRAKNNQDKKKSSEQLRFLSKTLKEKEIKNIMISEKGQQQVVSLDSLITIEAKESYCTLYTKNAKFLISKNLKHFEKLLDGLPQFIRVHKSWIVNKNYVENYSKSTMTIKLRNGHIAKLSKYKKDSFEKAIVR